MTQYISHPDNCKILPWRVSNTLDTDFCVQPVEEAISRFGAPEIFNTDQGAQFTSDAFTSLLKDHDININMAGRGRVQDNIFIKRLWWTLKYQYLYLWSFGSGSIDDSTGGPPSTESVILKIHSQCL